MLEANQPLGPAVDRAEREVREAAALRFVTSKTRPVPVRADKGRSASRVLPATTPDPRWVG
jgi:hypothetical protein